MKALPSTNQPLVYQLPGSDLIDSLPYIDNHMTKQSEGGVATISKSILKKIRKMITFESSALEKEGSTNSYLQGFDMPQTPGLDHMLESNVLDLLEA